MRTLYVSDLDGTLLNNEAKISERSSLLLNEAIAGGTLFTAATARTYSSVVPIFSSVRLNCPLILLNGAIIYDVKNLKTISASVIDNKTVKHILKLFQKYDVYPMVYFERNSKMTVEYTFLKTETQESYVKNTSSYNKCFSKVEQYSLSGGGKVVYMVTLDKKERLNSLYSELLNEKDICVNFYSDNYSGEYFLEISASGVSKANAALKVKQMLNADKIVAFGDNLNDIPMFEIADKSIATENACEYVKQIATDVIGKNTDDAVAEYIYSEFIGDNR